MQKDKPELLSVEDAFNIEITKSERFRAIILIGLLGLEAVFLLVIYFFYSEEYLQMFESNIAIYAILIFTFIVIVYEFLIHYMVGKRSESFLQNSRFFSFINGFAEVTLLSLLLIFIVEYSDQTTILQSPATLTYFIFIALSTFRLDFRLSVFSGVLSAVEYVGISIYYSTYYGTYTIDSAHPDLSGMQYLGQGLILVIAGIASGFVADLIRKKIRISFSAMTSGKQN
jgi:hypothetical protein